MLAFDLAEGGQYVLTTAKVDSKFIYTTSSGGGDNQDNENKEPSKDDNKR